jgi:hypothetical protein
MVVEFGLQSKAGRREGGKEGCLRVFYPVCVSRQSAGALVQDGSHLLMIIYRKISHLLMDKGEDQLKS